MKRKDFLKLFGLGAVAAVVAPVLITEVFEEANANPFQEQWDLLNDPDLLKNKTTRIKDTYKVTGSRASNVQWVKTKDGNYLWYTKDEEDSRRKWEAHQEREAMKMMFNKSYL